MIQQFEIPLSDNLCIYRFIGEDLLNSFMNDNSKPKTCFLFTKPTIQPNKGQNALK